MNYATERLLAAAKASLTAWESPALFANQRPAEIIEELESALFYFDAHGDKPQLADQPTAPLTTVELDQLGRAVQWAGHFATLLGDCKPDGPAFRDIGNATRLLELQGVMIAHSRATRDAVTASAA